MSGNGDPVHPGAERGPVAASAGAPPLPSPGADGGVMAPVSSARPVAEGAGAVISGGVCTVFFAYDVGSAIDLDAAERHIRELTQRETIRHRRRAPRYFEYRPLPLRVTQMAEPIALGRYRTAAGVDCVLYDFGAVSVAYSIPLAGAFADLTELSDALYENADLLADSRRRVDRLVAAILPSIGKPSTADLVEDYAIYQIDALEGIADGGAWVSASAQLIAQILRSEREVLSRQEVDDAMACRISYGVDDTAIIDWNAAMLFLRDADDVRAVLEFANVELLELRYLDDQLDVALERAYEELFRPAGIGRTLFGSDAAAMRRIARMQVDSAVLFEGVNNALKLLGDQYLARVYRGAAVRLHLPEWDASILRKLQTVESIYDKISDRETTRRMEILEWIIIILIAVSIIVMFIPGAK